MVASIIAAIRRRGAIESDQAVCVTLHRPNLDPLRKQIVEGEARLTELEAAQTAAKVHLEELRSELAALDRPTADLPVLDPRGATPFEERESGFVPLPVRRAA